MKIGCIRGNQRKYVNEIKSNLNFFNQTKLIIPILLSPFYLFAGIKQSKEKLEILTMAIQASPKWGKWGVGVVIPLALLLLYLHYPFWRNTFCPLEIRIKQFTIVFRRMGKEEMGEKERGLEGAFLMVQIFARASKSPLS